MDVVTVIHDDHGDQNSTLSAVRILATLALSCTVPFSGIDITTILSKVAGPSFAQFAPKTSHPARATLLNPARGGTVPGTDALKLFPCRVFTDDGTVIVGATGADIYLHPSVDKIVMG